MFQTIRRRLIASSLLALCLPLLALGGVLMKLLWDFYLGQLDRELRAKAFIIADAAAPILDPGTPEDPEALARMVANWRSYSEVRVTIVDARGMIRAGPIDRNVGLPANERLQPGLLAALAGRENATVWKNPQYGNQDTMYANVPVRDGARVLGAVRVAYTLTAIQQQVGRIRAAVFLSFAVYALLIVALTFRLAAGIAGPVEALNRSAERLAAGDLDHRAQVRGTVEVTQLANTLNQMSARLEQLEGLRRQYVSNVSHELRTPLAAIRGMAETLLEHGEGDPALAARYLPRVIAQTDRLARLASQLLDLAQIESGNLVSHFQPVSLAEVSDEAVHTCAPAAAAKGVQVIPAVRPDLPAVLGDRDRLVQVFVNLVDNAVRYTPAGGEVTVSARVENGALTVAVADTGQGIPAEHLPLIFDRFYRVDPSRSRAAGGTGLGLSIVRQIVLAHGGSIRAGSRVGEGTQIIFTLPLAPPAAGKET